MVSFTLRPLISEKTADGRPSTGSTQRGKKQSHTGLYRPIGFQEVKVPRFRGNGTRWW